MLGISVYCVGRQKYYAGAEAEFVKRLGGYCKLTVAEIAERRLPDNPSDADILAAMRREASAIEERIPKGARVIALCIEGEQVDSAGFRGLLEESALRGESRLCFVIGGSNGLDERIKRGADMRLSLSGMTFPHDLARIMLLEQIYRGFTMLGGGRYHK